MEKRLHDKKRLHGKLRDYKKNIKTERIYTKKTYTKKKLLIILTNI